MVSVTRILIILSVCCSVSTYAQTLDLDFEDWVQPDSISSKRPIGWSTRIFPDSGLASTNAYSGDTAMVIWNWYSYALGVLSAGNKIVMPREAIDAGIPIDFKPKRLKGYYRYDLDNNQGLDSAQVIVMLKRINPDTKKRDTIGYGYLQLPPVEKYTLFEVPIADYQPGTDPDSIVILFYSSKSGYCSGDPYCCYLTIDALSLETSSGISRPMNGLASVVPEARLINEGKEIVVLWQHHPDSEYSVVVYDVIGKPVRTWEHLSKQRETLTFTTAPALGAYLYEIRSAAKMIAQGKILVK